jgi:hypothetical protein
MSADTNTLYALVEILKRQAPEVLDLALAKTEEDFCVVFDRLMERAVMHLEKNAGNFAHWDEVAMSAVLTAFFNGMPGMSVVQEGHSNGHVDLTIEVRLVSPVQRRLAEAKIEKGPAYHEKGLEQLLTRYVTGREQSSWLILYVDHPNIKGRMQTLRDNLDTKRPLKQMAACTPHSIKWAFVSAHEHLSGEVIRVSHVGCNLHHP